MSPFSPDFIPSIDNHPMRWHDSIFMAIQTGGFTVFVSLLLTLVLMCLGGWMIYRPATSRFRFVYGLSCFAPVLLGAFGVGAFMLNYLSDKSMVQNAYYMMSAWSGAMFPLVFGCACSAIALTFGAIAFLRKPSDHD